MRFVFGQMKRYWPFYVIGPLALFATHWVQSLLPQYAKELAQNAKELNEGLYHPDLWKFALAALGILLFRTSSRLLFFTPARYMERDLRGKLMELLESSTPWRYNQSSSGQLFQTLFADTEQIRAMIGFAILQVGNVAVAMMVLLPKLAGIGQHTLLALTPMLVCFVAFTLIVGSTRKWQRLSQDQQGELQNQIIETYSGKESIKNYQAEKAFIKIFERSSALDLGYFFKAGSAVSVAMPLVPFGVGLSLIGGSWALHSQGLGVGDLVLYSGLVFLFLEPLMFVSWIGVVFIGASASWQRIRELARKLEVETPIEQELKKNNPQLKEVSTALLAPVQLPYWSHQIHLTLQPGKWSVLVGSTGCGKSELVKKLGVVLKQNGMALSYLSQSPYLYDDSLERNIFLGLAPTQEERQMAFELCQLLELDQLVASGDLEELMQLQVGENGKRLSGGQAKRLALIRTIMSKADVLLWDDPFSAIDVLLERSIVERLRRWPLMKDKTILLTAHRLTTVRFCDYVYYLDKEEAVVEHAPIERALAQRTRIYEYFKQQMV